MKFDHFKATQLVQVLNFISFLWLFDSEDVFHGHRSYSLKNFQNCFAIVKQFFSVGNPSCRQNKKKRSDDIWSFLTKSTDASSKFCFYDFLTDGMFFMVREDTVSAWMQPHSWIEPHPIQNLIQPQSKNSFETIEPQLEYNPTFPRLNITPPSRAISNFLASIV